jgi:prophage maintenance system killer protein
LRSGHPPPHPASPPQWGGEASVSRSIHPGFCPSYAAYAYGLAKNYGFADGNKRTAWIVARLFLADNGSRLAFDKPDAIATMEAVASGSFDEAALAAWFRERLENPT